MSGGRAGERAHCRQATKLLRPWACTKARASGQERKRRDGLTSVCAPLWARVSRRVRVRAAAMPLHGTQHGMTRDTAGHALREETGWGGLAQGRREMSAPLVPPLVGSWATNRPPAGLGARSVTVVNGCSLPSGAVYEVAYSSCAPLLSVRRSMVTLLPRSCGAHLARYTTSGLAGSAMTSRPSHSTALPLMTVEASMPVGLAVHGA